MAQVIEITLRLVKSLRNSILNAGRQRIGVMRETYGKASGVFSWAPQVSRWLNDAGYVWYLGVLEVNR